MRALGVFWGLGGVLLVIVPALYQQTPVAAETFDVP